MGSGEPPWRGNGIGAPGFDFDAAVTGAEIDRQSFARTGKQEEAETKENGALPIAGPTRGAGTFRYSKNRRYAGINRASRSLYSIWQMLNTWLTNDDEALQRVWGLVSIDGVAEEWTA